MPSKLGSIALIGFGVAAVSVVVAIALGGPGHITGLPHGVHMDWPNFVGDHPCGGSDDVGESAFITRTIPWPSDSDSVTLSLPAKVVWSAGQGTNLAINGPPAAVAAVSLDGHEISADCGGNHLTITLPGRAFRHFEIDGVSDLQLDHLNQPELDIDVEGAARVKADGVVQNTSLTISGAGSADLGSVITQDFTANLSGAASVTANPAKSAHIDLSGAGEVRLLNHPADYHASISGFGTVKMPDQAADTQ